MLIKLGFVRVRPLVPLCVPVLCRNKGCVFTAQLDSLCDRSGERINDPEKAVSDSVPCVSICARVVVWQYVDPAQPHRYYFIV